MHNSSLNKPVSTRMSESTLAALHFGYQRNTLGIELAKGEEREHSSGQMLVDFVVKIPLKVLTFLPMLVRSAPLSLS